MDIFLFCLALLALLLFGFRFHRIKSCEHVNHGKLKKYLGFPSFPFLGLAIEELHSFKLVFFLFLKSLLKLSIKADANLTPCMLYIWDFHMRSFFVSLFERVLLDKGFFKFI